MEENMTTQLGDNELMRYCPWTASIQGNTLPNFFKVPLTPKLVLFPSTDFLKTVLRYTLSYSNKEIQNRVVRIFTRSFLVEQLIKGGNLGSVGSSEQSSLFPSILLLWHFSLSRVCIPIGRKVWKEERKPKHFQHVTTPITKDPSKCSLYMGEPVRQLGRRKWKARGN